MKAEVLLNTTFDAPAGDLGPSDSELNSAIVPSNQPVVHPLVMVDDTAILPRDYIIHLRSVACMNCGTVHEWSEVYARNELPPMHNLGAHVQNLVPIRGFRYNLPLRVVRIESKPTPACHECFDKVNLSHLVDPRDSLEWNKVVRRKAQQALADSNARRSAEAKARAGKKAPSLDQLLKESGL